MSDEKKRLVILIAGAVLVAIGLGVLIHFQRKSVERDRHDAQALRNKITEDRALIQKTPELIKRVIVQRETDAVVKEILSDEEDINNLVRTLQSFEEQSEVSIASLKKQRDARKSKGRQDFDRVGYTLSLDANAFQFLSFLDKLETHSRFMSVTGFKMQAAGRNSYDDEEGPRHRVTLDVETYVYKPTGTAKQARIDNYERKRDLLISEISKRGAELRVASHEYRGQAGRRDPWIDPRVSRDGAIDGTLTLEQQAEIVLELRIKAEEAEELWEELAAAPNVIAEMKIRAQLEERLGFLDAEIQRVRSESMLTFVPARRDFDRNVAEVVDRLRADLSTVERGQGPSVAVLRETAETIEQHIKSQEYEAALDTYLAIEPQLALAEQEELKRSWVQTLRELATLAETVLEFESIELSIEGIAIYEDYRSVALINGQSVSEGELIGDELIVRHIGPEQIEFAYRGVILARVVETGPPPPRK